MLNTVQTKPKTTQYDSIKASTNKNLQRQQGGDASSNRRQNGNISGLLQTRLKVGSSNDTYEQEADRVADKVVRGDRSDISQISTKSKSTQTTAFNQHTPVISRLANTSVQHKLQRQEEEEEAQTKLQRQEEEEKAQTKLQRKEEEEEAQTKLQRQEEEEEAQTNLQRQEEEEEAQTKLQRQEEEEEAQTKLQRREEEEPQHKQENESKVLQTKTRFRPPVLDEQYMDEMNQVEQRLFRNKGKGEKLDDKTRKLMESGFSTDFSEVRIHQGFDAEVMNRSLKAHAFTHGKDIFFNSGKYEPDTIRGKVLLAHELTHVVQQGAAKQQLLEVNITQGNTGQHEPLTEPANKEATFNPEKTETNPSGEPQSRGQTTFNTDLQDTDNAAVSAQDPAAQSKVEATSQQNSDEQQQSIESTQLPTGKNKADSSKRRTGASKLKASGKGAGVGAFLRKSTQAAYSSKQAAVSTLASNEKKSEDASSKLEKTEKSVVPPAQEGQSRANASQVETVEKSKEPKPDEAKARKQFNQTLEQAIPTSLEDMDNFKNEGKGRKVGEAVKGVVSSDTQQVKTTYQEIENTPPAPKPDHEPEELPSIEKAPETPAMNLGEGMVGEIQPEHTDLSSFENESDQMLNEEHISDEQLDMVDSGDLAEANKERKQLKENVKQGPKEAKQLEQKQKHQVAKELNTEEQQDKKKMKATRQQELTGAQKEQKKTKSKIELKRQSVTDHINTIYNTANLAVKHKLDNLEKQSLANFDKGEKAATKTFEDNVKNRMDAFKRRRYDRIGGSVLWAKDKLFGIDDFPEVTRIFDSEKSRFVTTIDRLLNTITTENKKVIKQCKLLVANARKQIETFVSKLGPELKKTGQTALKEMQGKLDALNNRINEKEKELQKKLKQKREAAIKAIEQKIEKMKEEMSGLVSKLGNLLLNAMLKFFEWALKKAGFATEQLMSIINKGKVVIKKIVTDPIAFIGNIISAVKKGIGQFVSNIKKHLIGGLISWLTGAMADVPITLPNSWNLKGILSVVLQVLGLTWDRIRVKLVKRVGEKVVKTAETGVTIVKKLITEGPIALWEMIKEKAAEIKQQVMDGIRNWLITQVIKQAVIKLISFLNPAGAIVQAILAIYNTIMFFVENWQRIVDFVTGVFSSITEIAAGKISAAAAKVESAMAMTIPIILNFLARLLGLSGLGKAVAGIIKKIRKPIDKIVNKVIDKVVGLAKKLFKKGKAKVKAGVNKIVNWWKKKKEVVANGKKHTIQFNGNEKSAKLIIKSSPGVGYSTFLKNIKSDMKTDAQKKAHANAEALGAKIEKKIKSRNLSKTDSDQLVADLNQMANYIVEMKQGGINPPSVIKYGGLTAEQGGTKATASILSENSGGSKGSEPADDPPIWKAVQIRKSDDNKRAYVQGHLLNHNVHGPGKRFNMTPITYTANANHKTGIEKEVKSRVLDKKQVVFYQVEAVYGGHPASSDYTELKGKNRSPLEDQQLSLMEADRKLCTKFKFTAHQLLPKGKDSFEKGEEFGSKHAPVDNIIPTKKPDLDGTKNVEKLVRLSLSTPSSGSHTGTEAVLKLPGIGKSRASDLLNNGPYSSWLEVQTKNPGISENLISEWKNKKNEQGGRMVYLNGATVWK